MYISNPFSSKVKAPKKHFSDIFNDLTVIQNSDSSSKPSGPSPTCLLKKTIDKTLTLVCDAEDSDYNKVDIKSLAMTPIFVGPNAISEQDSAKAIIKNLRNWIVYNDTGSLEHITIAIKSDSEYMDFKEFIYHNYVLSGAARFFDLLEQASPIITWANAGVDYLMGDDE